MDQVLRVYNTLIRVSVCDPKAYSAPARAIKGDVTFDDPVISQVRRFEINNFVLDQDGFRKGLEYLQPTIDGTTI